MNYKAETDNFLKDLERVAQVRLEVANCLERMTETIELAELEGKISSGGLGLNSHLKDVKAVENNLRRGVFRFLVLGDMKRGKSTFLNALIGEKILPSDVNHCPAILTILRYGKEKKVTLYFHNDKQPQQLDFQQFKQAYTIDTSETKQLEQEQQQAFSAVNYAVVEYPLTLLEKGIEIIDSSGLNDTETRNEFSLGYINNCHAVLFVMRASQPCTLAERRYLENYIKGRGVSIFFLINAWDRIREGLIDPDDEEELQEAEAKLRRVFRANLEEYCQIDGLDIYDERVFPISAIQALRRRVKNPSASLEGTGFPEFLGALNTFLTKERAIAQLRQARTIVRQAYTRTHEAIERRIPLLEQDANHLKRKINSVEPEFKKLTDIRDRFQPEIRSTRDTQSKAIADSFRTYILNFGNTFETDFWRYQPDLELFELLSKNNCDAFNAALQKAFEQYINDKLSNWTLSAEKDLNTALAHLAVSAAQYGASYAQVTDEITEKITGQKVIVNPHSTAEEDNTPAWTKWAMGLFSLARGNLAGVAMAGAGFDWKNILFNYVAVIGIGRIISAVTGIFLGCLGLASIGLGVGFVPADRARQELVKMAKKELVKHLPQIASEQWLPVYNGVKECFDVYEREVTKRINDDIASRKAELDNLVKQKETFEVNCDAEMQRLQKLDGEVAAKLQQVENIFQNLLIAST
jgi:replication fork clamp-binding protein CrfC